MKTYVDKFPKQKPKFSFPSIVEEGKKYGLSNQQLSALTRYLNDKRLLRLMSLEQFRQNASAWLAAVTGIIAEVLAMDAHVSIWMDKKTEKPRNWILSKINDVIPTKIDDIAIKALTTAQQFTDETLLPLKEQLFSKLSANMHDKYQYHSESNHLGYTLKELKDKQKEILKESEVQGKEAQKTIRRRQIQAATTGGLFTDNDGHYRSASKYKGDAITAKLKASHLKKINERIDKINNENNKTKDTSKQNKYEEGEEP